jgi:hypothetical protein
MLDPDHHTRRQLVRERHELLAAEARLDALDRRAETQPKPPPRTRVRRLARRLRPA